MVYRKCYDPVIVVPVSSGSAYKMRRTARRLDDGTLTLVDLEEVNVYAQIQSYRDGCDIAKIIQRYRSTGDPSVLQVRSGVYADVTGIPQTRAEASRLLTYLSATFDALPDAVRGNYTLSDLLSNPDRLGAFVARWSQHLSSVAQDTSGGDDNA